MLRFYLKLCKWVQQFQPPFSFLCTCDLKAEFISNTHIVALNILLLNCVCACVCLLCVCVGRGEESPQSCSSSSNVAGTVVLGLHSSRLQSELKLEGGENVGCFAFAYRSADGLGRESYCFHTERPWKSENPPLTNNEVEESFFCFSDICSELLQTILFVCSEGLFSSCGARCADD